MAQYIPPELRDMLAETDPDTVITLALVPSEDFREDLLTRAANYDGVSVNRELPSGVVLVELKVGVAEDFISTPSIASASSPDRTEVMN